MKIVMKKAHGNLKVGDKFDATPEEFGKLYEDGFAVTATEWEREQDAQKIKAVAHDADVAKVKAAVVRAKERNALPPADEQYEKDMVARYEKCGDADLVVTAIDAKAGKADDLTVRKTSSAEPVRGTVATVAPSLRDVVRGCFQADLPFLKSRQNGGLIRAANMDENLMKNVAAVSLERSLRYAELADMVAKGADLTVGQIKDVVRADYVDPAGSNPQGTLNTNLLIQWNLGSLANQLAPLDDITTDVSTQPVAFNQRAITRYITVPGVQVKTATTQWGTAPGSGTSTGTVVDVDVKMDQYAGVPIQFSNYMLAATPRQLFNEMRQPQLYSLGEYIIYKLVYTAYNGSTRTANDGTTTSTITFNAAYGTKFNVAGATLGTFVADLPAAMDLSKFPGGDEAPGDANLQRFAWIHTSLWSNLAKDTNFLINQSIWGAIGKTGENLLATGRFERIGNTKLRKSQLVTDQCTVTGAGTAASPYVVTPGTYSSATYIGLAGTRSCLLFVNRVPLDYTKVLPDVPSTAAIEMVTEPRTGLTFLVVKYLDHAYETANARVQTMFGTAIGDERQGLPLNQK